MLKNAINTKFQVSLWEGFFKKDSFFADTKLQVDQIKKNGGKVH